jgi:hypothetical protein
VGKEAWVADYVDQTAEHHLKTFVKKRVADSFVATANVETRAGVHTADSASTIRETGKLRPGPLANRRMTVGTTPRGRKKTIRIMPRRKGSIESRLARASFARLSHNRIARAESRRLPGF